MGTMLVSNDGIRNTQHGLHRLVVRTSRCGHDNPGSTPGVDTMGKLHDLGEVLQFRFWTEISTNHYTLVQSREKTTNTTAQNVFDSNWLQKASPKNDNPRRVPRLFVY